MRLVSLLVLALLGCNESSPGEASATATTEPTVDDVAPPIIRHIDTKAVSGEVDRSAWRRFTREHRDRFTECYARAFDSEPGLAGNYAVEFDQSADGSVSNATEHVESEVQRPEFSSCMIAALQALELPRLEQAPARVHARWRLVGHR